MRSAAAWVFRIARLFFLKQPLYILGTVEMCAARATGEGCQFESKHCDTCIATLAHYHWVLRLATAAAAVAVVRLRPLSFWELFVIVDDGGGDGRVYFMETVKLSRGEGTGNGEQNLVIASLKIGHLPEAGSDGAAAPVVPGRRHDSDIRFYGYPLCDWAVVCVGNWMLWVEKQS